MHIIHPLRVNAGIVGFNFNGKVVVVESFEVGAHFGEISLGTVEMSKIGTTPFLEGCFCQILNQIVRRGILSDCLVASTLLSMPNVATLPTSKRLVVALIVVDYDSFRQHGFEVGSICGIH